MENIFVMNISQQMVFDTFNMFTLIGIPLYIRAEAVIRLSVTLAAKGMELSAVMALIISSAGTSLTEVVLLKSILKIK